MHEQVICFEYWNSRKYKWNIVYLHDVADISRYYQTLSPRMMIKLLSLNWVYPHIKEIFIDSLKHHDLMTQEIELIAKL